MKCKICGQPTEAVWSRIDGKRVITGYREECDACYKMARQKPISEVIYSDLQKNKPLKTAYKHALGYRTEDIG
jgi:hypothetical protein